MKDDTWESLKVEYGNWKVSNHARRIHTHGHHMLFAQYIVQEKERLGSEEAFWARYTSEDGRKLQYSKILKRLKASRITTYAEDVQAAREYFRGDLTREDAQRVFMSKSGRSMVHQEDRHLLYCTL